MATDWKEVHARLIDLGAFKVVVWVKSALSVKHYDELAWNPFLYLTFRLAIGSVLASFEVDCESLCFVRVVVSPDHIVFLLGALEFFLVLFKERPGFWVYFKIVWPLVFEQTKLFLSALMWFKNFSILFDLSRFCEIPVVSLKFKRSIGGILDDFCISVEIWESCSNKQIVVARELIRLVETAFDQGRCDSCFTVFDKDD